MRRVLRRIWRSSITTIVLGILFVLSFSSAIYYHVNIYSAGVTIIPEIQLDTGTILPADGDVVTILPGEAAQIVPVADSSQNIWRAQAERLLEENGGRLTAVYQRVSTSKRATSVIFEGLGSVDEANRVISALRGKQGLGTFFVTRTQLLTEMQTVTVLVRAGEQIGILVDPGSMSSVELMCDILETLSILSSNYGYTGETVLRPLYGLATQELLECGSALGCPVVAHTFLATPETVWNQGNPEKIAGLVFTDGMLSLQRGGIALFEMGAFTRDDVLGNFLRYILDSLNPYPVIPVTEVIRDTASQYIYPLPDRLIMRKTQDTIYPGHTTYANVMNRITSGYIGLEDQNKDTLMPGFTYMEREALNKTGMVRNQNDQVFLTFMGWGSDVAIDAILSVLEKHNAHATFFLLTAQAAENPNLVRAIAAAGHDIGTMTHTGAPLAIGLDDNTRFVEIKEDEANTLREDIVFSYDTLVHICGDMLSDSGKPSVTTYLRPPELAVSRRGLEVAFDLGISYCVLGSYDCEDDEAKRASDLANDMRLNTRSGSVLILRLEDECIYTAEALDRYLARIKNEKYYRFVGLSMALK